MRLVLRWTTFSLVSAFLLLAPEARAAAPELDFPPPGGWIRSLTARLKPQ